MASSCLAGESLPSPTLVAELVLRYATAFMLQGVCQTALTLDPLQAARISFKHVCIHTPLVAGQRRNHTLSYNDVWANSAAQSEVEMYPLNMVSAYTCDKNMQNVSAGAYGVTSSNACHSSNKPSNNFPNAGDGVALGSGLMATTPPELAALDCTDAS